MPAPDLDEDQRLDEPASEAAPEPAPARQGSSTRRWVGWLRRNSWMVLAAGAALVLVRVVEFRPPEAVRVRDASIDFVGEAPQQEFATTVGNPQAVQLRATLRLYPRPDLDVLEIDPELDASAEILSQPVVTTIYGMHATIDQTVRLDEGELELELELACTPRLSEAKGKHALAGIELEQSLQIVSRRKRWLGEPEQRMLLHAGGTLTELEERPYRWVFTIEDHLFALDLELHRGG